MERELNDLGQLLGPMVSDWRGATVPGREHLVGEYCRLEPLEPACHQYDLYTANSEDASGRMWTYLPYGPFASLAVYDEWMQANCLGQDPLFYAVIDGTNGRALGLTSYLRIIPEHGSIEIGHVAYSPSLQRSRVSTEASSLLLRHAFALGYRRVEWKCNALNEPSRVAARRLGFSFEGVFRQHVVVKGRSRDTAWYAITDQEWPAIDAAHRRWLDASNFDATGRQRQRLSTLTAPLRHHLTAE